MYQGLWGVGVGGFGCTAVVVCGWEKTGGWRRGEGGWMEGDMGSPTGVGKGKIPFYVYI